MLLFFCIFRIKMSQVGESLGASGPLRIKSAKPGTRKPRKKDDVKESTEIIPVRSKRFKLT